MNKIKTIVALAALFVAGNIQAQTVSFSADDINIEPGKTSELNINLDNSFEIVAWSISLDLPENVFVAYEEEEGERYYDESIKKSSRHTRSHVTSVIEQAGGGYTITCYANPAKKISGNSGNIVTVILQAGDTFSGQGTGTIRGQVSTASAAETKAEDATFNIATPTGIKDVNAADGMQADGKYLINGELIIKKGNSIFNGIGAKKK